VSIRYQLLVIALTTLVLPWAGCEYARELEGAERAAQEGALAASAATIARALAAEPSRVVRDPIDRQPFEESQGDLYVFPLRAEPLLDGYVEDWQLDTAPRALPSATRYQASLLAGSHDRFLYLYLEVDDPSFVPEPGVSDPKRDRFTRVMLWLERTEAAPEAYFFATSAQGPLEAKSLTPSESGDLRVIDEPRIQGFWLQTSRGYHLEARVPLNMTGKRVWIEARAADEERRAGTEPSQAPLGGRLFLTRPGLDQLLATFVRQGTRATVVDVNSLKLGTAGTLDQSNDSEDPDRGSWYRRFIAADTTRWPIESPSSDRCTGQTVEAALAGRTEAQWLRSADGGIVLRAAAPIIVEGSAAGAVVLEQTGEQLLAPRDRALSHLFNFTLLATALAVLVAFAVAASIGITIGRLRQAADSAVGADGRIRLTMPESGRGDEIGALARAFERVLSRLNEHTVYLRSLGGKLAHELRTPLAIVRSSLENLESEGVRSDQQGYVLRARDGVARLQFILSALGAAARVEESIQQAERMHVNLEELVASAAAGYRDAFPNARILLEAPPDSCPFRGAPELLVQLLDKLIENAVDFCPPQGTILVRLARSGSQYEIAVINDGPLIPAQVQGHLFESLFEHRPGRDDRPHFGLGLYIVRLIAEFHGGSARAANREDGGGVVFSVILPSI
jgi:two-component system, OmpR family, sensor histidine kinase ChvG